MRAEPPRRSCSKIAALGFLPAPSAALRSPAPNARAPSFAPESEYLEKELLGKEIGEAPPSRLERVGLLTELGVSAPASRARGLSAIKTNAPPKPLVFQCRLLAMTP